MSAMVETRELDLDFGNEVAGDDDKFWFSFGSTGEHLEDIKLLRQEDSHIETRKVDYLFEVKKHLDLIEDEEQDDTPRPDSNNELKSKAPMSFLSISTVEEGVEWYQTNYPQYPDYICEVLANYHFGDWKHPTLSTQKDVLDKDHILHHPQKDSVCEPVVQVEHKEVVIDFD